MSEHNDITTTTEPETDAFVKSVSEKMRSRRGFLVATGAAGLTVAVAACGSSTDNGPAATGTAAATSGSNNDGATAKVAASLEVLAVGTYKAALDAATAGKLGPVPPAVAKFATTAMEHHQAALDKWNGVITGAGGAAVTAPPADLKATVDKAFGDVKDITGVAKLALLLEQTAADTYQTAVHTLSSKDAITLAGSIQIIDQQHAAVLLFVLGQYPVPDVFQKGDKAYKPSA